MSSDSPLVYPVKVRHLIAEKDRYQFPEYQRSDVSSERSRKILILSVLLGDVVPAIIVYKSGNKVLVQDGRQRLETLWMFYGNNFHTPTAAEVHGIFPDVDLIEPGKFFSELTVDAQEAFLDYNFGVQEINTARKSEADLRRNFLFMNLYRETLTPGERLHIYTSKAKTLAEELTHEHFFPQVYYGDIDRQEKLYMALRIMYMELCGFPINARPEALTMLASGVLDRKITDELKERLKLLLNAAAHLYANTKMKAQTDIIPIYQSLILLERNEIDLFESEEGMLTRWFYTTRSTISPGVAGESFAQLRQPMCQQQFWDVQLPVLLRLPGLVKKANVSVSQ